MHADFARTAHLLQNRFRVRCKMDFALQDRGPRTERGAEMAPRFVVDRSHLDSVALTRRLTGNENADVKLFP